VKKVTDIVGEIASAAHEQSSGIEQVNQAVTAMDEMTQQNAALVEQAAAASETLEEQASGLETLMQFFKLSMQAENGNGTRRETPAPAGGQVNSERRRPDSVGSKIRPGAQHTPAPARSQSRAPARQANGDWESF